MNIQVPNGYEELGKVLEKALGQAAKGKGVERHVINDEPFHEQFICEIGRGLNSPAGPLQNAIKKTYESQKLGGQRGITELLGAINYLAAGVILMQENEEKAYKRAAKIDEPTMTKGLIGEILTKEKLQEALNTLTKKTVTIPPFYVGGLVPGICESDIKFKKLAGKFSIVGKECIAPLFNGHIRKVEQVLRGIYGNEANISIEVK